jgi:hypothetical protein
MVWIALLFHKYFLVFLGLEKKTAFKENLLFDESNETIEGLPK